MKFFLKIFIFALFNLIVFNVTYYSSTKKGDHSIIRQALAKPEYRYWEKVDGKPYCEVRGDEKAKIFESFDAFTMKKTNVVYLTDVNILSCLENLTQIASELHKRDLEVAINLDQNLDYKSLYSEDFSEFKPSQYLEKYKDTQKFNDWIDYIVVDNAMEFMTYSERRGLQSNLRSLFSKPAIGFRFTKHYNFPSDTTHPNRQDKKIAEFLPKEDDGDFIITSIKSEVFKRTYTFIEDQDMESLQFDGEFL